MAWTPFAGCVGDSAEDDDWGAAASLAEDEPCCGGDEIGEGFFLLFHPVMGFGVGGDS